MAEVDDLNHPYYEKYINKFHPYARPSTHEKRKGEKREHLITVLDRMAYSPDIHYEHLEGIAPFIRSAGYDSYIDYEETISEPATGIAIFDPSNIKGVFAQYDPSGVPEGYKYADDIMFSKEREGPVSKPPTELLGIDSLLSGREEILPLDKKNTTAELAAALQRRAENSGYNLEAQTEENSEVIARIIADEAKRAYVADGNAANWYREKIDNLLGIASELYPELKNSDHERSAFVASVAFYSNGLDVSKNLELAVKAYEHFRKTGRLPEGLGIGPQGDGIESAVKTYNAMLDEYGLEDTYKILNTETNLTTLKQLGYKVPAGDAASFETPISYIFGPKIGGGFYQNLLGNFSPITMDRWFMRTWGRITGTIKKDNPKKDEELREKFRANLRTKRGEKKAALIGVDVDLALTSNEYLDEAARKFHRNYRKLDKDTGTTYSDRSELNKTAKNLDIHLTEGKIAPANGSERTFIRATMDKVLNILSNEGIQLDTAAVQALIWYPEKELYIMYGAANAKSIPTDYEQEIRKIANEKGVSEKRIARSVDGLKRGRNIGSRRNEERGYNKTGKQSGATAFSGKEKTRFVRSRILNTIRSDSKPSGASRGNDGAIPQFFRRKPSTTSKKLIAGVPVRATERSLNKGIKNRLTSSGIYDGKVLELESGRQSAEAFHKAISEAKSENEFGAAVYVYPESEYREMKLFVTPDGSAGLALKGDDIVSLFSKQEHPHVSLPLASLAIQEGGRRLDAFDTALPSLYNRLGFKVASRLKWDEGQAPPEWDKSVFKDFNNGEPDVVFMVWDADNFTPYSLNEGALVEGYDEAVSLQDEAVVDLNPADYQSSEQTSTDLLEEIKEYRDENRAIDEAIQRTPEGSPLRSYIESNEKLQDDIAAYQSSSEPPLSFQTVSHPYGALDKFVYNIADKFIGLQKVEDAINKGRRAVGLPPISTIDSAYAGEQSISGKAGNELTNFERGRKEPLAEKIAKSGLSREQVDEFLILRHAIERNNRIALRDPSRNPESTPGSGRLLTGELLTNSFVKRRMSEVYGLNWNDSSQSWEGGNSRTKNLSGIVEAADQIINETLDRSVQGGLLGREAAESIRSIYKYYAPLQGKHIEDDFAATMSGNTGKSYSVKGKEVIGALGRESAALSPLGNIITNAEKTISRSLNNKEFGQKLVSLIENNPNPDFWEVYSPKNPRYKRNFSRRYKYIGTDSELVQQTFTSIPPGMSKKDFIETIDFTPDRNTTDLIGVKIDGQQYYVDIKGDDRLREALVVSDSNSSGAIISTLGKVNRFLSMVNTQLNPEFIVGNFSRDIQTAVYNIIGEQDMKGGKAERERLVGAVLKDVMPSMGVFYKALRRYNPANGTFSGDQTGIDAKDLADWKEFMEAGAKADWFHTRPPEEQANTIDNMVDMANGTFTGNFRKRFKQVMDFVEDANSAVENAVRLSTFKAARDSFMDSGLRREEAVAKAADLAKNLTVNFNRKGMQGDLLNSIFLFFNASVQGTRNFARGLFGPNMNPFSPEASRRKQGMVAGLTLFSAFLADMGEEESEINPETGRSFYSEIPDYIKERNLVIMADPSVREGVNTSSTYIGKDGEEYEGSQRYYLIPLPYGYNVFSYLGTALSDIGRGNMSVLEASANLTSALLGSFSPVGISPLPTVAQPFVEIANNKNFFGSPIYKDAGMFGGTGPDSALSMRSTAAPFKFLAETANALTQKGEGSKFEKGALDVSPDTLEHLFEFAMGGAGKFGLRGGKFMGKIINGEEIELRETPFVRRIMGETDSRTSQADYYDRIGGLKNKETALKNLQGAERLSYRNANEEYIRMFYLMKNTETSLSKLRKRRKAMKKSAGNSPLTAKAFAEYEEKFFDYEKRLYNRFNKQYDKILGRGK